ncbi:MAG: hypothetical protein KKF06_04000, partial [Candidatus Margulisbacteria bacterium]|nr:hypothetical protein [Candidatus Margulisiibacteriota bacterium]
HEKRDNEWVPRFQQFPPARQIDYLRIFFSHHNPRNFFEKATETTARRISVLAKHDLALARTIFWRLDEISRSGFDQAVFYALTSQPLLQTQLLVARGVTQGARLLTETFEDRPYDDLEAVHILAQGKGLTLEEKKILQEIGKRFFQHRGGSERALIMHRLVVWQAKVKKAVRFTKYVEHKIMSSKGKNIEETAESKKSLDKIWAQLCNGLGRFSASDLYDLLSLFYKNDRFLVLEKMVENGYIDQVDAFDYYQTFEMGNK